ncbi:CLRC complex-Argonaute linker protein Stc1 [Schizosaccharomyces pombe]|uniref:Meiotic chromosome segregation protein P8B7.28c n=1 Tax=Schizosaccharomyces pombe (strain 972 / ATCC 24843) TaxID=284812 RepID=YORS_SCHPO|nr:LIM-like protein Stc1 [Schizosaccharomyces pombe]O94276.1 RecName: Full=Meiotic chromosome segregation protein P8B7.28c [Schizosaccharomyces pombe 972h-]CAA21813.1 LIM-like protein linking chromatin modification to RNAi, Stc1 [Schizosaccharomyces pombe]|eukprot:NP_596535.1 LIM-like protein Stc1 [Schizosaccharomyces pombe]
MDFKSRKYKIKKHPKDCKLHAKKYRGTLNSKGKNDNDCLIMCMRCRKVKGIDSYSKTQWSKTFTFVRGRTVSVSDPKVICRTCQPKQHDSIWCTACQQTKGINEFSKAQRHVLDPRCQICVHSQRNDGDDNLESDKFVDPFIGDDSDLDDDIYIHDKQTINSEYADDVSDNTDEERTESKGQQESNSAEEYDDDDSDEDRMEEIFQQFKKEKQIV